MKYLILAKLFGSFFCNHNNLGKVKPAVALLPVISTIFLPKFSFIYLASVAVLPSFHNIAGRIISLFLSKITRLCICPENDIPSIFARFLILIMIFLMASKVP